MSNLRFGSRLDRFDYENLGMNERWYVRDTIIMLVGFEMEIKGYFAEKQAEGIYDKLFRKYTSFISKSLFASKIPFNPALDDDVYIEEGVNSFDMDRANFSQCDFMSYLKSNNEPNVVLDKLQMVLAGQEVPGLTIATSYRQNSWHNWNPTPLPLSERKDGYEETDRQHSNGKALPGSAQSDDLIGVVVPKSCSNIFEKTGKGWNLRYGDVVLMGVKDWLGMTYIKNLLENPGVKLGVLDLQQMAGYCGDDGEDDYEQDHSIYDAENPSSGGLSAWEAVDATARGSYRTRLEVIAAEVKDALSDGNTAKVAALREEAAFIQKELQQSSFKTKDPEIDKSRKRVTKAILDTIKNIGKLEGICGYGDKPISGHLKRNINTGSYCSYTVVGDKLPDWRF